MNRRAEIERSLEIVAERHGDPAAAIYSRLFAARPELEAPFVLDRTGAVRGNMLKVAFDTILDIAGPNAWGMNFLLAERINHSGVNVPPTEFLFFLDVVRDTMCELCGPDWTSGMGAAWDSVLAQIAEACAEG